MTMKKTVSSFKWLCAIVLSVSLFTACEPDESSVTGIVSFEDVALDSTGYWNGSDLKGTHTRYLSDWGDSIDTYAGKYVSGILSCKNVYEVDPYGNTWWKGMACSNHTDRVSIGYGNQYSVYSESGANGSAKFAVLNGDSASCTFNYPVRVNSLMINNATYAYLAMKDGKDGFGSAHKFKNGDYFSVTIAGITANGLRAGESVDVYLADFRNGKTNICNTWTEIPLENLGYVKKLVFTFHSTDSGINGINTPAYACIDNLKYTLE